MAQTLIPDDQIKTKSLFYSWPCVLIGWVAMLIFAGHACTHMVAAGDTWVAMACGRHFVNHGVNTVEPFSANSHKAGPTQETMQAYARQLRADADAAGDSGLKVSVLNWCADKADNFENWPAWQQSFAKYIHPTGWVNQNWLTHVIFYSLVPKSTYTPSDTFTSEALVYWKFAVYILIVICVYNTARLLGVNPLLAAAFTCFAIFTGRSYFDIRPAGFSNLMTAAFLLVLVLATYKNILYIWLLVPMTVLWSNLHGGYIYIFIVMVPFIIFQFLTSFSKKTFVTIGRKGIYHSLAAVIIAFIAMIIFNPFHLTNLTHTFVIAISKHAEKWRSINEWHPAFEWSNPVGTAYPFLIMFVLGIGILLFWFFSRALVPKLLTGSKDRLGSQSRLFDFLLKIFAITAAIFIFWVVMLSFAFIDNDLVSFVVCVGFAVALLLSIYQNVAFISLSIPVVLIALSVSLSLKKGGLEGRYIYPFIMIPAYCIMCIIASLFSKKVILKAVNIAVVAATAVVLYFLVNIIYNPFGMSVPVWPSFSIGEFFSSLQSFFGCLYERATAACVNLLDLKVRWYPAFIHNAEPSYDKLFVVLYIINIISIAAFAAFYYWRNFYQQPDEPVIEAKQEPFKLPKVDVTLWVVAALTVYLAFRSRRFIAIAAIAACPVIAMLLQQIICNISASTNFYRHNRFSVPAVPRNLQTFFLIAAFALTAYFGTAWGIKFKSVYLDPWPMDYKFTSVFMRMSASDAKPFEALKFIKDNKLSGNMFNYWTEGGFIAWGQQPDPNTGKTPLQLFMDGRAQAAYQPQAFDAWTLLMQGGREVAIAMQNEMPVNYKSAGVSLSDELRRYGVWVILMPYEQFDSPVQKVIEANPDWLLVYFDNKQRILVDKKNPKCRGLFEGIFDGTTIYPDEFSKNLILSYYKFGTSNPVELKEALDYAIKAFYCEPSQTPIERILIASKFSSLKPQIDKFCGDVFDDFEKNKAQYERQDGYHNRMITAIIAAEYLRRNAEQQNNPELVKIYTVKKTQYENERVSLAESKRW
jgi:hypothetical protein